jgi:hypothetical protein
MPTPTHDVDTCGLGISYAHLYTDGVIIRFGKVIGRKHDLKEVTTN